MLVRLNEKAMRPAGAELHRRRARCGMIAPTRGLVKQQRQSTTVSSGAVPGSGLLGPLGGPPVHPHPEERLAGEPSDQIL